MAEEEEDIFIKENPIIFKKYKVRKKLGEGAFGDVYLGQKIENNEYVAIKVEQRKIVKPILVSEAFLLYSIAGLGIPEVKSLGKVKNFNVLVEPLLGKSLFDIFTENHKEMAVEDVCLIGKQVVDRIQWVHSKYIVHRDIKPDNFLIGRKDPNIIYLIDFGLSKKYRSSNTNRHIRFGFTGKLTGTVRFASANALRGGEQSRRDDIESIGYMLIYFLKKRLPWQGVTGNKKMERYLKIYKMKKNFNPEEFCGELPEMVEFIKYAKKLEFEQEPDYNYLRKLLNSMLKRKHNTNEQLIFSWIKPTDIPNLKNPINPASRKDSPQSRIYKKIKSNLEKGKNLSSDNDSKNGEYQQTYTKIKVPQPNLNLTDNNNESEFSRKISKKITRKALKAKEGLNTMVANLDVTVDENVVDFENESLKKDSKDNFDLSRNKSEKGNIIKNNNVNDINIDNNNGNKINDKNDNNPLNINNENIKDYNIDMEPRDNLSNLAQNEKVDDNIYLSVAQNDKNVELNNFDNNKNKIDNNFNIFNQNKQDINNENKDNNNIIFDNNRNNNINLKENSNLNANNNNLNNTNNKSINNNNNDFVTTDCSNRKIKTNIFDGTEFTFNETIDFQSNTNKNNQDNNIVKNKDNNKDNNKDKNKNNNLDNINYLLDNKKERNKDNNIDNNNYLLDDKKEKIELEENKKMMFMPY